MKPRITFIHSGDIHLGAPFRGFRALSDVWAEKLVRAIPQSYERLVETCISEKVDFLLLSGDVFDTDKPSYAHYQIFFAGLKRLEAAGIPVYIVAGNHDPLSTWDEAQLKLSSNVHLFPSNGPGFKVFAKNGEPIAVIAGRGFSNVSSDDSIIEGMTHYAALRACGVEDCYVVGMLHTGLWMDPHKAPCSEKDLLDAGMDYWALGHIHKRYVAPKSENKIAFCGCLQGRDIKENGNRGCLKVSLCEGMPSEVEFVPLSSVVWERVEVDVSACAGLQDVQALCIKKMFEANVGLCSEDMVARIVLTGVTPLYDLLCCSNVLEDFRCQLNESYPSFFCDAVINQSHAPFDKDGLLAEKLFPAVFLRQLDEVIESESVIAYLQQECSSRGIAAPKNVKTLVENMGDSAADIVLSLLDGRGSE